MVITRFNPSANGALHLGHIFTLLVNEHVAHKAEGHFFVRFDDVSYTAIKLGKRMGEIISGQIDDIRWLKVEVDGWSLQSDILPEVREKLKQLKFEPPAEDETKEYIEPQYIRLGNEFLFYPYAPRQTAERVIMDNMMGVTHLIRGEDFITEFSYYNYLCQIFSMKVPEFVFLPRLSGGVREISKSNGGFTLTEYIKNGYSPDDVKEMLARSCLYYPLGEWELHNIKSNPVLIP